MAPIERHRYLSTDLHSHAPEYLRILTLTNLKDGDLFAAIFVPRFVDPGLKANPGIQPIIGGEAEGLRAKKSRVCNGRGLIPQRIAQGKAQPRRGPAVPV